MKIEKDYEELLKLLNKNRVKYCIIGAYAVAFYSIPRYTKDIDILVEPTQKNAKKIIKALTEFGFGSLKLTENDFTEKGYIIQLGYEPVRIDIITSVPSLTFTEIWEKRKKGIFGKVKVNFIDIEHLIKTKKASSRKQDRVDLEILKKIYSSHTKPLSKEGEK
ncbi:MAG TPA: nucleotidyltransferase [bacterium]|nr:nucleotidyltransferase [bacterium]HPP29777.1 nucleotidyltransferase [bacterium]